MDLLNEGIFDDNISLADYSEYIEARINISSSSLRVDSNLGHLLWNIPLTLTNKDNNVKDDNKKAIEIYKKLEKIIKNNKKETEQKLNVMMNVFIELIKGEINKYIENSKEIINQEIKKY